MAVKWASFAARSAILPVSFATGTLSATWRLAKCRDLIRASLQRLRGVPPAAIQSHRLVKCVFHGMVRTALPRAVSLFHES